MKGLKKNLIYWADIMERMTLAMLTGIAVYAVMMSLMGGAAGDEGTGINGYIAYLWIFATISVFLNGFNGALNYFPMSISLGSTRKASYVGMQIMMHLMMLQNLLIIAVAYYGVDRETFNEIKGIALTIVGVFVAIIAFTNITCIVSVKFGKGVGMVVYVVSLLLVIGVAVIAALSADGNADNIVQLLQNILLKPYVFIGALAADVISIAAYYPVIKKQDLQL